MDKKEYKILARRFRAVSAITFRIVRQDMERSLKDKHISISPLSVAVIKIIAHKPCTIVELSRHMMIAPASLVPVIDSLEKKGYLKRGIDATDRRKTPLTVTKNGTELLLRISTISEDNIILKSMEKLGENKSRQLLRLSEEMLTMVSGNRDICNSVGKIAEKDIKD